MIQNQQFKHSEDSFSNNTEENHKSTVINFKPSTLNFNTGVTISVNKDKILAKDDSGSATIHTENLDNFTYQSYWEGISPATLIFRFHAISIVAIFVISFIFDTKLTEMSWERFSAWALITIAIIVINIIAFFVEMIDMLLDLGITRRIIRKYFSTHLYAVSIGNKSGNNIDFNAGINEKSKILNLEHILTNLKAEFKNHIHSTQQARMNNNTNENSLDELKKLGELYKSGILTEEEFNFKKQEILNKQNG